MLKHCIRIVFWFLGILIFVTIAGSSAVWFRYEQVRKSGEKVKLLGTLPLTEKDAPVLLGSRIPFKAEFSVPWGTDVLALTAECAEGSQLTAEPFFTKIRTKWGSFIYQGTIDLQPYRTGSIAPGKAQASFSGNQVIDYAIPSFEVKAPSIQGTEPVLAGAIDCKKSFYSGEQGKWKMAFTVLIALALAGIIILVILYFVLRKKEIIIPPWEKAFSLLDELMQKVTCGKLDPARSFTVLSDILREYLEKRFALRASRQTTAEFLRELEQGKNNVLSEEQLFFLREFLNTADLVKFAKQDATLEQISTLVSRERTLIRETIPATDGKHKEKEGEKKK